MTNDSGATSVFIFIFILLLNQSKGMKMGHTYAIVFECVAYFAGRKKTNINKLKFALN